MLPSSVAPQSFQPVAGRCCEVGERAGGMELTQLALRDALHVMRQPFCETAEENSLAVPISERDDHRGSLDDGPYERNAFICAATIGYDSPSSK